MCVAVVADVVVVIDGVGSCVDGVDVAVVDRVVVHADVFAVVDVV